MPECIRRTCKAPKFPPHAHSATARKEAYADAFYNKQRASRARDPGAQPKNAPLASCGDEVQAICDSGFGVRRADGTFGLSESKTIGRPRDKAAVGKASMRCAPSGEWIWTTGMPLACEEIVCADPGVPAHCERRTEVGSGFVGDEAPATIWGGSDGRLPGSLVEIGAGSGKSMDDGTAALPVHKAPTFLFSFGSVVTYRCDEGHDLVRGIASRRCGVNGWSGEPPECMPIRCPRLRPPRHGSVRTVDTLRSFGSVAEYACDEGFAIFPHPGPGSGGKIKRTCLATRAWSGNMPRCEPVYCDAPQAPAHGTIKARKSLGR
jgi:hypothetical protein